MTPAQYHQPNRTGGVYIAVLGTSLIVSVLALSALTVQRVQNRMLSSETDIRQAQLNAEAAIDIGLLFMMDDNWRSTQPHGNWFESRGTGAGTCSLFVTDPLDDDLANNPHDPAEMLGVGYFGQAERRVALSIDPRRRSLDCLYSALATGSSGQFEMPDWQSVSDFYQTGTSLNVNSLPTTTTNNFGRNVGIEQAVNSWDWTGAPPGIPTATVAQSTEAKRSGTNSLKVSDRGTNSANFYSGAAQRIDEYVEPGQQYVVSLWVYWSSGLGTSRDFILSIYAKGGGNGSALFNLGSIVTVNKNQWTSITATIPAPVWNGTLEYAFVKIGGGNTGNLVDFYVDDFSIREYLTGRLIYQKVLTPGVNQLYSGAPTNAQGLYWIDCGGNDVVVKRSRIHGSLLLINPGANSRIADGPNFMAPAVAGYPALLVNGNFAIRQTGRNLSEVENGVDYNLDGMIGNYIYPSEIRGLVAVSGDLTFVNAPQISGQVVVGGSVTGSANINYQPDSLLNPPPGFTGSYRYERRPGSVRRMVAP